MKNQSVLIKIGNAVKGFQYAWKNENNIRLHSVLGLCAVIFFLFLQPALVWWALIILCIVLVMAAELINSAIEAFIDHVHIEFHDTIGAVKDMLAAMVLIISLGTVLIALLAWIDTVS